MQQLFIAVFCGTRILIESEKRQVTHLEKTFAESQSAAQAQAEQHLDRVLPPEKNRDRYVFVIPMAIIPEMP